MNNFPYPTVTVFGASGFIGRYVVKRLAERGVVVRAVCRKAEHGKFLKPMGEVGQITPIGIDIHDAPALKAAVAGSDAVINLMGILYQKGRNRFDAVHHQAPKHIAEACRDFHVKRFIHISAIGANPNAKSLYAKSKGLGEADIVQAFPAATILRPSIVFGAEDNFFNLFASLARLSPVLPLIGGGHTKFQPVYVGDVADAAIQCLEDSATTGKIYELGGPEIYSFRALLETMFQHTGRRRLLLPLPFWLAKLQAFFLELLPHPLLTRDQVELLKSDNIVHKGALSLKDLGIKPTGLSVILPTYMDRFKAKGRFSQPHLNAAD